MELSESQAQRIHRWVEKTLIVDKRFHLPNKKELLENDAEVEILLVDATESPIERPKKNTKKNPLLKEEEKENKELSSKRIFVENVIGSVKRFRILFSTYRNRRKRFSLRFNLISAIYNFEL